MEVAGDGPMTNPDKTFEALKDELSRETRLEPKERSREHENATLQYFLDHGKRTEDHDLWRECYMHEEMLAIMDRRFMALNPHKGRHQELNQAPAEAKGKWSEEQFNALHKYEQEVDQEGSSLKELDGKCTTRDPAISRQELEVQAAENYLDEIWGIKRKQTAKAPTQHKKHKRAIELNPNPELSFRELQRELQMAHNSYKAITEAAVRAIKKGLELREDPPWPMEACAAKYQIVKAKPKKGKDHPTPAACKYQKIYEEIED
jgi:hypothetical protein